MNVAAHQQQEPNSTVRQNREKEAKEEKMWATGFRKESCPSAVVQRAAKPKNDPSLGRCPRDPGPSGSPTAISAHPGRDGDHTTTMRRPLIGAEVISSKAIETGFFVFL